MSINISTYPSQSSPEINDNKKNSHNKSINSTHKLQVHSMKDIKYVSSQPNSLITNDMTISQHFDLL